MRVVKVKQTGPRELALTWDDGHPGIVTLKTLRDACPCAGCKGETVLFRSYAPPAADVDTPGRYELKGAQAVGNYALQFFWGDGHAEGIYIWDHLRSLCECPLCIAQRKGE
jgi:DUF971 family protein